MKSIAFLIFIGLLITGCREDELTNEIAIIGKGEMPAIVNAKGNTLHLVYGTGDSILYVNAAGAGNSFSPPALVAVLPELAASHSRGPQIAVTESGITVIACNEAGNIFSYLRDTSGRWSPTGRVNDVDTTAKEGLMALSGDGSQLFAVWLDLRDKHNKLFGASSTDGGKSWSKNILVYASPDTTVCECCKPSVVVKGSSVHVMFRNWLNGNRDLYLIQSVDGGSNFGKAQKLGEESWALNGCPMDGGGLAVQENNIIQTVWRRKGKIYRCEPGQPEKEIGEGKSCTITLVNNQPVYAWTEKGEVICLLPKNGRKVLGKGSFPIIKPIDEDRFVCVWQEEKQIRSAIVTL